VSRGGTDYDRDVSDRSMRTSSGFTTVAEEAMATRQWFDPALLPKGRVIKTLCKSPIALPFDVTGSLGGLAKITYDKMPMTAGELKKRSYLQDCQICPIAVGDVVSDRGPLQIGEFVVPRELDSYLQRLWLEGGGGRQGYESYEFVAYFLAYHCDIPEADTPFVIFIGDERFREDLHRNALQAYFGGIEHEDMNAFKVFADLRRKFKNNVFLIHRYYDDMCTDKEVIDQWSGVLGADHVINLGHGNDTAVADVMLGIFALMGGTRTLDQYLEDMRERGQDQTRLAFVRRALSVLKPPSSIQKKEEDADQSQQVLAAEEKQKSPSRKKGKSVFDSSNWDV